MEGYKWDKAYMSDEDIELLVRIKEMGAAKRDVVLDEDDLQRLERLIVTYSMPKEK